MGTHPIFESDFDCLTEGNETCGVLAFLTPLFTSAERAGSREHHHSIKTQSKSIHKTTNTQKKRNKNPRNRKKNNRNTKLIEKPIIHTVEGFNKHLKPH